MPIFAQYLSTEKQAALKSIAEKIVAGGKGILAADESTGKSLFILKRLYLLNRVGSFAELSNWDVAHLYSIQPHELLIFPTISMFYLLFKILEN